METIAIGHGMSITATTGNMAENVRLGPKM
jgi:hypothetical protein